MHVGKAPWTTFVYWNERLRMLLYGNVKLLSMKYAIAILSA